MSISYQRTPCPSRIMDDLGGGFLIGGAAGAFIYFIKGIHSIKDYGSHLKSINSMEPLDS